MKLVHISDTHGKEELLNIPECDVLVHTGDLGGRTTIGELMKFLVWFEKQPAKKKIFIAGNHDIVLDKKWIRNQEQRDYIEGILAKQYHYAALELIANYDVKYLNETDYVYEGVKFFGSPYSPSFHRENWVFNADRGQEICKHWGRIPSDVDVLLTHTPVYQILDRIEEKYKKYEGEDLNAGCEDLLKVIHKRLLNLKLHCSGHIHNNYGLVMMPVSNTRHVLFSNGAAFTNEWKQLIKTPIIINI